MENREDILKSLESLEKRIQDGEIEVLACHEAALKEVIKDYHIAKTPLTAYFDLENWLHEEDKPIKIASAMIWGALWVVSKMGCISWDDMRRMYGEFMSKKMGLR